jgi:hypothetical protein
MDYVMPGKKGLEGGLENISVGAETFLVRRGLFRNWRVNISTTSSASPSETQPAQPAHQAAPPKKKILTCPQPETTVSILQVNSSGQLSKSIL